jgi:hypothetical protein
MTKQYLASAASVCDLSPTLVERMGALYLENYDGSSIETFRSDLLDKDEALLLAFGGELVGFTTLKTYDAIWNDSPIRVLYSGDTIVSPPHWGQQQLAFSWISRIGQIKRSAPDLPLYWFLLVKGHRTYKYLSVFGKSFFPHWDTDRSDLKPLADKLASEMFCTFYNPLTGVVEFPESRGHLKEGIAFPSDEELTKAGTQFFCKRNPGYLRGHELVCLCELEEFNMKPLTARIFQRSLRSPI